MLRLIVVVIIVFQFGEPGLGWAQSALPDHLELLVLKGIQQTMRQEYRGAESTFRTLAKEYSHHPAPYLFWAGMLQARASDFSELLDRRMFDSLLGVAEEKASRLHSNRQANAVALFYAGSVQSYQSYAASVAGEWFPAVSKGISAVSKLNQALAADSSLVDCYVGIGTYNYWKSRKTQFLNWLPFVSDNRAEGISQLRVGFRQGRFNRYLSASSLVIVLLDAGEYAETIEVADAVLAEYPSNRHFLQAKGVAYEKWGDVEKAIAVYEQLLESIRNGEQSNPYGELNCHLKLADFYHRVNQSDRALNHLRAIRAFQATSFPEHIQKSAAQKIGEGRRIEQLVQEQSARSR